MKPQRVTSAQVAKRAGVSRSAVSRVFTPGASVSEVTAAKVREAADALGYRPNAIARSLLTGQSRIIGLVVSYLDNHFYPPLIEALSSRLQARGYHLLMFMAGPEANADDVVSDILDYQVDGLVLASVTLSSDLAERCRAMSLPIILLNRRQGVSGELAVVSDNEAGGRLAARHLLASGARRIGYITGRAGVSTQEEREAGFLAELVDAGVTCAAREEGNFNAADARAAARAMFASSGTRPDAVFVANDYMALNVLDSLRYELGLSVPRDVSVVGFDDVPAAAWPAYGLTTIRQDIGAMADHAMTLLTSNAPVVKPLPVTLVERQTT